MRADRRGLFAVLAALLVLALFERPAQAHHVAGHGSSEGVRNINSLGNRGGRASTRLMLLDEFLHSSGGVGRVPATRNDLSLLGEYAPLPAFSLGASLPFTVLHERPLEAAPRTAVGLGDARAFLRWTPHADKLIHRTLTLGLSASFPTRTVRATIDPGDTWTLSPSLLFTRTYGRGYWQLLALAAGEARPAGLALDASVGAQGGARVAQDRLALGGGVLVDVRAANWCRAVGGGLDSCLTNRPGESEREVGSTRATLLAHAAWSFHPRGSLTASVQVPVTPKRDFDVGASLGVQALF